MSLFFKFRSNRTGAGAGAAPCGMEAGVAAPARARPPPERSPARSGLHVNFSDKGEEPLTQISKSSPKDSNRFRAGKLSCGFDFEEQSSQHKQEGYRIHFTEVLPLPRKYACEVKERREKFLTAKYGSHQMALIRKRLAVEMWLYDELQKLYDVPKEAAAGGGAGGAGGGAGGARGAREVDVDVDVDELLDMDSDELRRAHLATLLADAKKPQKDVHNFINELLDKAKTL